MDADDTGSKVKANSTQAIPSWPTTDFEWPSGKYYERLGDPFADPSFAIVFAPSKVIEAIKPVLGNDPSDWLVQHIPQWTAFYGSDKPRNFQAPAEIVTLVGRDGKLLVFEVKPTSWIRLNDLRAVSEISRIMKGNFHTPYSKWDDKTTLGPSSFLKPKQLSPAECATYADSVTSLFRFQYRGVILSSTLLKPESARGRLLQQTGDSSLFISLCKDPAIVSDHDNGAALTFCLIGDLGAVERWTLQFESADSLDLKKIDIKTIYPDGTFSNPPLPD